MVYTQTRFIAFLRQTKAFLYSLINLLFMANFEAVKIYPVEIAIPAGAGQSITFPNQPSLNNKRIIAMEVFTPDVMARSPLTQAPTLPVADMVKGVFEFYVGNLQQAYRYPVLALNRMQGAAGQPFARDLFRTFNWLLSFDKCNLVFTSPVTNTGTVLTIHVHYVD